MDDSRLYYYNGEWQPYQTLHDEHGITLTPSTPITVYDNSLNGYHAWVEQSTNLIWVVRDSQWYTSSTLPYWIKLDTPFKVYLIDEAKYYDAYKYRDGNVLYDYNGDLKNFDYMHNTFGMTRTPSSIYSVKDGIIECWFNPDIAVPYWDVYTRRWLPDPPSHDEPGYPDDIDAVGATGMFLYYSRTGSPTPYGTLVDGSMLQPMCLNFPDSGELSLTRHRTIILTGTWKILTETGRSSKEKPCIVFATKILEGNDTSTTQSNTNSAQPLPDNSSSVQPTNNSNFTEITVYDL